jgi:hypothetical protein
MWKGFVRQEFDPMQYAKESQAFTAWDHSPTRQNKEQSLLPGFFFLDVIPIIS